MSLPDSVHSTLRLCRIFLFIILACASNVAAQDARSVAKKVFPSLVTLEMNDRLNRPFSQGSGFFVRPDIIVTNYHVIEDASFGSIKIVGGTTSHPIVGIVGMDKKRDLALVKVSGVVGKALPLADISMIEVGQEIFALGSPKGLEGTISPGIISGSSFRQIDASADLIQITNPISSGSSGGPVVNVQGEVIGVAVGSLKSGQNLNFAIPGAYIALLLANLKAAVALTEIRWNSLPAQGSQSETPVRTVPVEPSPRPLPPIVGDAATVFREGLKRFEGKQYSPAIAAFRQYLQVKPDDPSAYFNIGLSYYNQRDYNSTIPELEKAVQLKPDYPKAHYWLGSSHFYLDRFAQAAAAYRDAIRYQPNYVDAHIWLGVSLQELKQPNDAIRSVQTAIQFDANNGIAHYRLGLVYQSLKRHEDAIASYKNATRLRPEMGSAFRELGNAHNSLKQFPDAIVAFNAALKLDPNDTSSLLGLGNSYYNDGKYAASIPLYKRAVELNPSVSQYVLYLGDAYFNTKQDALAKASYDRALTLAPRDANVIFALGVYWVRMKNAAIAREQKIKLDVLDTKLAADLQTRMNNAGLR